MKIRVFQSDKGDCLLITSDAGANILVDGGMSSSFQEHVQPFLGQMSEAGEHLDLLYVSHIDQDHIGGVLQLLDNTMLWRVHDYRTANGLRTKQPKPPRMPEVKAIWHNAFSMLIGENAGSAEDLLAQSSQRLSLSADAKWIDLASKHQELAYSVSEAIRVSRRIAADQLSIPLNGTFAGQLILVREPAAVEATLGGIAIRVVGPFAADVEVLRDEWNAWLRGHKAEVAKLREKAKEDAAKIGQANDVGSSLDIFLKQLGNRDEVTAPNLASVMLLLEEAGKRVLLTGDGHPDDIIAGLEHHGVLKDGQSLHLDVLKFQHHGSEHNVDRTFCQRVFADHYIFCGNGRHENPDLDAVQLLLDTNQQERPNDHYKIWFSCSPGQAPAGAPRAHMKALATVVSAHAAASGGKVSAEFLDSSSVELSI
jgi:beta-lactamase superfamily II metal-dependent hydrolase